MTPVNPLIVIVVLSSDIEEHVISSQVPLIIYVSVFSIVSVVDISGVV